MTSESVERYLHGHHESAVAMHARRTAAEAAAFLLPLLRPGLRVLDVGCGPGTITAGLAEVVAPGEVIGIDAAAPVIERARQLAAPKGLVNLGFEVGSIYEPARHLYDFDVVYAHQVLQHLARPVEALAQVRRLLKPGGVVAVRDVDYATRVFWPPDPRIDRFYEIYYAAARLSGGEPDAGRRLRAWLTAAEFDDVRITTSTWTAADTEATCLWGEAWATRALESNISAVALESGVASRDELEELATAWREWGRKPEALYCFTHFEGIGRRAA